jgi:regulator of protease activity HflC (stomatin/prohibitin superfamily)
MIRLAVIVALAGCGGTVIEPGHRGLVFDAKNGGLHHEVLAPGRYRVGSGRMVDYDVTYSTRAEPMKVLTVEGLQLDVKLAVVYRPIIAELYELESEVGPRYYDEVVGPELRSAAREAVSRHSFLDLTRGGSKLEDEIEVDVRHRIAGKHVELSSVVLESVVMPPEIIEAVRAREIAEQKALREKQEAEEKWQKEKVELEHEVVRHQLKQQAEDR